MAMISRNSALNRLQHSVPRLPRMETGVSLEAPPSPPNSTGGPLICGRKGVPDCGHYTLDVLGLFLHMLKTKFN